MLMRVLDPGPGQAVDSFLLDTLPSLWHETTVMPPLYDP